MRGMLLVAVVACNGDTSEPKPPVESDTGTPVDTDTEPPRPGPDLVIAAANNYALDLTWTVQNAEIRAAEAGALVSWTATTLGDFGEPVVSSKVPLVALFELYVTPDEVGDRLEADDLGTDLVSSWDAEVSGSTFVDLEDLSNGVATFSPENFLLVDEDKTWLAAIAEPDGERYQILGLVSLTPTPTGPVSAEIDDSTSTATWSATMGSALTTATGWDLYTVAWSDLGDDALGKPYDKDRGDELFFGRLAEPAVDLAPLLLDLEPATTSWYTMDVEGEDDARLDLARAGDGSIFAGFEAGTWVMGVRCSTCLNPFPLWVTALVVEP